MVVLLQQPERLPDYFAGGVVSARFHLGAHEFLQLAGERNVHGFAPIVFTLTSISKIVNLRHNRGSTVQTHSHPTRSAQFSRTSGCAPYIRAPLALRSAGTCGRSRA